MHVIDFARCLLVGAYGQIPPTLPGWHVGSEAKLIESEGGPVPVLNDTARFQMRSTEPCRHRQVPCLERPHRAKIRVSFLRTTHQPPRNPLVWRFMANFARKRRARTSWTGRKSRCQGSSRLPGIDLPSGRFANLAAFRTLQSVGSLGAGCFTPLLSTSPGITVALIRVKMGSGNGDSEVSTTSGDFASCHVLGCALAFLISGEWLTIDGQAELATS